MLLTSVESVIDALGAEAAQELAGVGRTAVCNWRARGRIPSELYLVFAEALEKSNTTADPALFGLRAREDGAQ